MAQEARPILWPRTSLPVCAHTWAWCDWMRYASVIGAPGHRRLHPAPLRLAQDRQSVATRRRRRPLALRDSLTRKQQRVTRCALPDPAVPSRTSIAATSQNSGRRARGGRRGCLISCPALYTVCRSRFPRSRCRHGWPPLAAATGPRRVRSRAAPRSAPRATLGNIDIRVLSGSRAARRDGSVRRAARGRHRAARTCSRAH
jgi:hypothetical protein